MGDLKLVGKKKAIFQRPAGYKNKVSYYLKKI